MAWILAWICLDGKTITKKIHTKIHTKIHAQIHTPKKVCHATPKKIHTIA